MANQWFRLYSEFMHDPKVQIMSEQDQRRLVMLLCMKCNADETLHDKYVTFMLRISAPEWEQTKSVFIESGFIDSENNILNWDKRQFVSDSSAERVKRHKDKKKQDGVTPCNVTVTPPEQIQNRYRTDTEQKKPSSEYSEEFEVAWSEYPSRPGASKKDAFKASKARLKAGVNTQSLIAGVIRYAKYRKTQGTEAQYIKQPVTFFGPNEHYLADWTCGPPASRKYPSAENFDTRNYGEGVTKL